MNLELLILQLLRIKPITPKSMKDELNIHFSQVSLILKELDEKGLIICVTPYRTKGKIYCITELGKDTLSSLSE